eukprot:3573677-Pyramimonas_sp.AAC.1
MSARTQELIGLNAPGRLTMLAKRFSKAGYHIVATVETRLRSRMPSRVGDFAVYYAACAEDGKDGIAIWVDVDQPLGE